VVPFHIHDIAAVVLDSPPPSPQRGSAVHFSLLGLPGWPVAPLAVWLAAFRAGADWSQLRLPRLIERIPCPLLVVTCGCDAFMPPADRRELQAALDHRRKLGLASEHLVIADARHLLGMQTEPEKYAEAVGRFLLAAQSPDDAKASGGVATIGVRF